MMGCFYSILLGGSILIFRGVSCFFIGIFFLMVSLLLNCLYFDNNFNDFVLVSIGNLPSPKDLTSATSGLFIMEDWHNFGLDYAKTLESWRCNFINSWGSIGHNYGDKFYRMWVYYLSFCAGMFKARRLQVYQIVYCNDGLKRGYRAVR